MALIYVTFLFLFARLLVAVYNFYSRPRLSAKDTGFDELVSILIPARNEGHNLPTVLDSILAQKRIQFEIIILDDNSEDDTHQVAVDYALKHEGITVIEGLPLKEGWTGKNFACWQLAQAARGEYLLFLDADVQLKPLAVCSALNHLKENFLSLLSLFPEQKTLGMAEKTTVPLMHYLLLTLLPIRLIAEHRFPIFSAACGQFMLFPKQQYQQYGWHRRLKDVVTEDLAIMKAVKQEGLAGAGLMSAGLVKCRMYSSLKDAVMGFSKNFIAPFDHNLWLFLPFIVLLIAGPLLILATKSFLLISSLIFMLIATRIYTSLTAGENCLMNILLHPIQMANLSLISFMAVYQLLFKASVWKGRKLNPIKSQAYETQ